MGDAGKIYEAENAELSGGAYADYMAANPTFYFSNDGDTGYKGVKMDKGGVMTYTVEAPADGKYRFDFNYANGTGSHRNDMSAHDSKNVEQTYSLDGKREQAVIMNNTLFETITGTRTLYYDLTAGTHTVAVKTTGEGTVSHDFLRVTYAGDYGKDVPLFDKLYETEQADFNLLLGNTDTSVKTESGIEGYSGNGYVTGLSERTVTEGGSIVSNENSVEPGGEYTLTVCPDKEHVLGRILINGADRTAEAVEHDGKYSLTVKGVSDNQTAEAYFAGAAVPKEALAALAGALDIKDRGDYTEDSYNAFAAAKSYAEAVLKKAGAYQCETDSAYKDLFLAVNGLEVAGGGAAVYFVDCGDHDPSTLSSGDSLGTNNSLTDMIYGEDPVTKMMWGAVDPKNSYIPTGGGNRTKSKGAYTVWTWANENSPGEIADGQPKEATFRYARNQDSEGITPRRVEYKFELAPGLYDLKVCVGNYWGNSGNVDIYASGEKINENTVSVPIGGNKIVESTVEISSDEESDTGSVLVSVQSNDPTVNVNYILISEKPPVSVDGLEILCLPKTEYAFGEELDAKWLLLKAEFSDGRIKMLTSQNCEFNGYDPLTEGKQTVEVTYEGRTVTYEVNVSANIEEE